MWACGPRSSGREVLKHDDGRNRQIRQLIARTGTLKITKGELFNAFTVYIVENKKTFKVDLVAVFTIATLHV
jgi:hypothetical protein